MQKLLPFTKEKIEKIVHKYQTPFHLYDEEGIRNTCRKMYNAFSWATGFKNYYAVKACPNPYILEIVKQEGMGMDCSSLPELLLSEKIGVTGENIMFTSNNTPKEEFKLAKKLGAVINLDDITHISFLEDCCGLPDLLCFRYNPGPLRVGNKIIGNPKEAKYGLTRKQILEAYKIARQKGVQRFGLHTMVVSNELDSENLIKNAEMLFELVIEVSKKLGITMEFVDFGGGYGIPYNPDQNELNLQNISKRIQFLYKEKILGNNLPPLKIFMECGRYVTGPHGYLVTRVIHKKETYKRYIGVDACMANLMRPALYGAYHHETVIGKENYIKDQVYDVVGSLCENNDKFAIDRNLPEIAIGDIIVIHDTGAHGYAMGFNYNGKLRSAELLLDKKKKIILIRRAETVKDYFVTLNFSKLQKRKDSL